MMTVVKSKWVLAFLVAIVASSVSSALASSPDKGKAETENGDGNSTKVVTESETSATLKGAGTQLSAKGYAEWNSITVTDTTTTTSTTNSVFTVTVKRLTLADGKIVTFNLNGTAIGTSTVTHGRAKLRLSTKKGATVPTVSASDTLTVIDPDNTTIDLTGAFGPITTQTGDN